MRITINAARLELSTHRECEPDRWNSGAGKVNGIKEDVKSLNTYLISLKEKIHEVHRFLIDKIFL